MNKRIFINYFKIFIIISILVIIIFFKNNNYFTNSISAINASSDINNFWKQWSRVNDGDFYLKQYINGEWIVTSNKSMKGIDINAENSLVYYEPKRNAIIAVIDTGVQYTLESISKQIWINKNEIKNDALDNDCNGYIDDIYGWNFLNDNNNIEEGSQNGLYHGTQIVGTLCSNPKVSLINGIVSNVDEIEIMCLKILDDTLSGTTDNLINAINYAERNGATICCLSLCNDYNDELKKTIEKSSMLFIVAAGNQSLDIDKNKIYPASYECDNIIVVANLKSDGTLNKSSNYGKCNVDIAAPGTDVLGLIGDGMYNYSTGTSFAVPYVAGTAALIYCNSKTINIIDVKSKIIKSAKKLDVLSDATYSKGILDINNALADN